MSKNQINSNNDSINSNKYENKVAELKIFVENKLKQGYSQKVLKEVLLLKHWPRDVVDDLFLSINADIQRVKAGMSYEANSNAFENSSIDEGQKNFDCDDDESTKGAGNNAENDEKSKRSTFLKNALKIVAEENLSNYLEDGYSDLKRKWNNVFNKKSKSREELNKLMPSPDSVLLLDSITKSFGQSLILKDVRLDFKKQDIVGIIGLSGSGKTTLLNLITGFLEPDAGKILYKDLKKKQVFDVFESKNELTRLFGLAPQRPSFYHKLTVWENLDYFASLYNMRSQDRKKVILSLLELVNLEHAHDTLGEKLSGGMQRRLGIACSLVHDPEILILDEPTADLDPILRKEIWALIKKINKNGKTILLTSHFLNEVEDLCTKIGVLHKHKICAYGTKKELETGFSQEEEFRILFKSRDYTSIIRQLQKQDISVAQIDIKKEFLFIRTKDTGKVLKFVIQYLDENPKEEMLDFELNKPTLNQLFESIIQPKKYWS